MSATNKQIGKFVFVAMVTIIAVANALFTFAFGGTYGAEILPTGMPALSYALGGLVHLAFYDFAALGWFYGRTRENTSTEQRGLATILSAVSMLASIIISGVQLALTTTLVDLQALHGPIGLGAFIMLVVIAGAHFAGLFAWKFFDPEYREVDNEQELASSVNAFRLNQRKKVIHKALSKAEGKINQELEALSDQEANYILGEVRTLLTSSSQNMLNGANVIDQEPERQPRRDPKDDRYSVWINGQEVFTSSELSTARRLAAAAVTAGGYSQVKSGGRVIEDYGIQPASVNGVHRSGK